MPAKGSKGKEPVNKGKPMPAAQLARQRAAQPHNRKVNMNTKDGDAEADAAAVRTAHYHDPKQH